MEQIVKKLYEAAVEGNTETLLHLLQKDPLILDRCIATSYEETPLHVAAMLGHLDFCSELVSRKPKLAGELDYRRSSALHLASANGHVEIVKILVSVNREMCLAYDGDGRNPIHVAAMKGKVDVLKILVGSHPDAARAKVKIHQGENVLHLCVQYYQLEALMCLVEAMGDDEFVNTRDDNGNSILHLAVVNKQVEIIEYLVSNTRIDIDAENSSGFKPSHILAQTRRDSKYLDISQCLQHSKVGKSQEIYSNASVGRHQTVTVQKETIEKPTINKRPAWLEQQQTSVMLVASIIATMAFQANFAPPGGYWQDTTDSHKAGVSILSNQHPDTYKEFMVSNTIGFITSLIVILLLMSEFPSRHKSLMWFLMLIMCISLAATANTFSISMANDPSTFITVLRYFIVICTLITGSVMLVDAIRLVHSITKGWSNMIRVPVWTGMVIVWIIAFVVIDLLLLADAQLNPDDRMNIGALSGYVLMMIVTLVLVSTVGSIHFFQTVPDQIEKFIRDCWSPNPQTKELSGPLV